MLADVGMVKTYSKSAHVNDLGFAWTGPPPCCMDRLAPSLHGPALLLVVWTGWPSSLYGPALLFVPTVFPPGGFAILASTHCTIPTSALVFGGNIFTHVHPKEVRIALHTVQPPFLVSGFLWRFLLLFRSSATFRLYYSIQPPTTIPT